MEQYNEFRLSFYKELCRLNSTGKVALVQHIENRRLFVRKERAKDSGRVYEILKKEELDGIPRIYEIIEDEDRIILIEEYIQGETIDQILKERVFTEDEVRDYIIQLCRILGALHRLPDTVIHRDIKPSNIILSGDRIYIVDFDAAKIYNPEASQDTVLLGTAGYAAPEQYGFSQSDQRTDIYSMGVLMNEMLTGSRSNQCLHTGSLSKPIKRCLNLDAEKRYGNTEELSNALTQKSNSGLPGFRTRKLWKMILAIAAYGFTIAMSISMIRDCTKAETKTEYIHCWGNGLSFGLVIFAIIFYLANFRGFRDIFPIRKLNIIVQDIIRIAAGTALLFITIIMASILFETIIMGI